MQRLIKNANKVDYYNVLGVSRSATNDQIQRAFRKHAAKHHPDRFPDEKEKAEHQKIFRKIAEAKEVLMDPSMFPFNVVYVIFMKRFM